MPRHGSETVRPVPSAPWRKSRECDARNEARLYKADPIVILCADVPFKRQSYGVGRSRLFDYFGCHKLSKMHVSGQICMCKRGVGWSRHNKYCHTLPSRFSMERIGRPTH